ncbi:uncharacterized protein M421DRAFT_425007 [Didymella exigua CBS 183.55]|uniref:Uncharacterized protein n=1 Tax=Didymella exigua CBS 183.55 TaxID=1150837 RepID=A0A6A5R7M6_9PLEO|nr:uncharacterized protein M421DRAFT_425007 [Didymella exigua CBS 183.55]KAF1924175.1 hypothetical protein M421DRAFT_425007 [Didymella exigua CBS 183.55]
MIITTLLTLTTLAAALSIPSPSLRATNPKPHPKLLESACTFTLQHRQQSSTTYIQLITIIDHANAIRIDVAGQRPPTEYNSYVRLDDAHVFAMTGLLDERNLTISTVSRHELEFEIGEVRWSTRRSGREAGCNAGAWEGGLDRRERRMVCLFPCEKVAMEDRGDVYGDAGESARQVRIGLQG